MEASEIGGENFVCLLIVVIVFLVDKPEFAGLCCLNPLPCSNCLSRNPLWRWEGRDYLALTGAPASYRLDGRDRKTKQNKTDALYKLINKQAGAHLKLRKDFSILPCSVVSGLRRPLSSRPASATAVDDNGAA